MKVEDSTDTSDSDSDTSTSSEEESRWEATQHYPVMTDLNLHDSDDESDEDYRENHADMERYHPCRPKNTIKVPKVDIFFCVPRSDGTKRVKFTEFPSSFVKEVVKKLQQRLREETAPWDGVSESCQG
jgi:hypothetical protein